METLRTNLLSGVLAVLGVILISTAFFNKTGGRGHVMLLIGGTVCLVLTFLIRGDLKNLFK